jgi:hypothetical protein
VGGGGKVCDQFGKETEEARLVVWKRKCNALPQCRVTCGPVFTAQNFVIQVCRLGETGFVGVKTLDVWRY